jgi:hypothetical protein
MPTRTEKKFGQANQVSWGAPTQLVASSANRRNIAVNVSARTAAYVGLATFTSAPIQAGSSSYASISAADGGSATLANAKAVTVNQAKNKFIAISSAASANVIVGSIDYSSGNFSTTLTTTSTVDLTQLGTGLGVDSNGASYTSQDSWTIPAVFIDDYSVLAYSPETVVGATSTEDRLVGLTIDASGAVTKTLNYHRNADEATSTTAQYRGVYPLQYGYGYSVDGEGDATVSTSGAVGLGIRTFSGATVSGSAISQTGTIWWDLDATVGKTSGQLQNFFSVSDYNSKYDIFAICSPTTTANPWLGAVSTGGTGVFASNRPTIPSTVAPAGFRIVANNGTNGASRSFMDGTTTYPSAPTGITPGAPSSTNPSVTALKFSPNGEYLAATYYASGNTAIYVRQSDGSWVHTYTVNNSAAPANSGGPSQTAWSADSTTVFFASNGQSLIRSITGFQGAPGAIPVAGYLNFKNNYTTYAGFPGLMGVAGAIDCPSITANPLAVSWTHSASTVGIVLIGSVIDGSGKNMLIAASTESFDLGTGVYGLAGFEANINVAAGTTGAQPGYINSVMSATKLTAGETIQVSNIVLESGESLYISSSVDGGIDAVAYGVEIS